MKMIKYHILRAIVLLVLAGLAGSPVMAQRKKKEAHKQPTPEQVKQETEYLFVEAERQFILKNYSKATEALNKCLTLDPVNDVVYYKLAEIYNTTEQYEAAAEHINRALKLNKSNKYYYLLAVDIQSNLGNLSRAAILYEQLIKEVPKSDNYLFNLAAIYIYQKEYNKALATYDKAEEIFGLNENISYQRQKIYLEQNQLEKAINESKALASKYPDNLQYALNVVDILSSNNRLDEAATELKIIIANNPEFMAARLHLADIYWKQQNFTGFEEELILAFKDKDLALNAKINMLMRYMSQLPNPTLQKVLPKLATILTEVHPDDSNAFLIAGDLYTTLLDKKLVPELEKNSISHKALDAYTTYVGMDPANFSVWQNLLNLEMQLQENEKLAKHSEQALEFFPNQAWLYLVNGIVKLNENNYREAALLFEMGRKRASSNKGLLVVFYSYLGDVYQALGEYSKSDKAYESVLEIDPLNYTVLNNYSYYLSLRGEKLDLAKKMSTTLIRNNPDNNTFLDTYAWVHFALGDYKEAKRVFERIIASGVSDGVYYDHYGDTLFMLGETDKAVIQWKKAKELDKTIENIDQKISQRKIIQ